MLNYKIVRITFFISLIMAILGYFKFNYSIYYILLLPFLYILAIIRGSSTIAAGFFMNSICNANTIKKEIALTFDDGPDPIKTPILLDYLKAENCNATFFIIGKKINGNEALLKRIHQEGHILGNHSFSHSYFFDFYGTKKVILDLEETKVKIKSIVGNTPNWFRPPYGVTNPNIAKAVKHLELTSIGWDVRSLDTIIEDSEKLSQRVTKSIKPGSILLFHDTGVSTLTALKEVISFVKNNNYSIIGLDVLINEKPYKEL